MAINSITIQPTPERPAPRQGLRADVSSPAPQPAAVVTIPQPEVAPAQEVSRQAQAQATVQASDTVPAEELEQLVARISEQLISIERRSISFQIHQDIGRTIVSVIDIETDEVIRQISSEELVRIAEVLQEINAQRNSGDDTLGSAGLLIQDSA